MGIIAEVCNCEIIEYERQYNKNSFGQTFRHMSLNEELLHPE